MTLLRDDRKHGEELSARFLAMCQADGATGTALLNAMGNALVGFFMVTPFENHEQRMQELGNWCHAIRNQVDEAYGREIGSGEFDRKDK